MEQARSIRVVIDVNTLNPTDPRVFRDLALAAVDRELGARGGWARAHIAKLGKEAKPEPLDGLDQEIGAAIHGGNGAPMPTLKPNIPMDAPSAFAVGAESIADLAARTVRSGFDPGDVARANVIDPTTDAIKAQNLERAELRSEVARLRLECDKQAEAEQRAFEMYREARPVVWLLDQLDVMIAECDRLKKREPGEVNVHVQHIKVKDPDRFVRDLAAVDHEPAAPLRAKLKERDGDIAALRVRLDALTRQRDAADTAMKRYEDLATERGIALADMAVQFTQAVRVVENVQRSAKESIARMVPLCEAAQKWEMAYASDAISMPYAHADFAGEVNAYQEACAKAANANEEIPG